MPDNVAACVPEVFFARDCVRVAADLIGATLLIRGVGGVIAETEAYRRDDPASHSHQGRTLRNAAMFGPPGSTYVYRSYGRHWCFNIVCRSGEAVLLRALEPSVGIDVMQARRGITELRKLCAGPGRLGQALSIGPADDGCDLGSKTFSLTLAALSAPGAIIAGPRIGITRATDCLWRFGLAGSPYLSRPF